MMKGNWSPNQKGQAGKGEAAAKQALRNFDKETSTGGDAVAPKDSEAKGNKAAYGKK